MRRDPRWMSCWFMLVACSALAFADDVPKSKVAASDAAYLAFGKIIEASGAAKPDWEDPHQVAAYAVGMCRQGNTKGLIKEMGHVQEDADLGKSLLTFVSEFGPDLQRYKDKDVFLEFHGYSLSTDTSIWYYWLTDKSGKVLEDSPWVSAPLVEVASLCADGYLPTRSGQQGRSRSDAQGTHRRTGRGQVTRLTCGCSGPACRRADDPGG